MIPSGSSEAWQGPSPLHPSLPCFSQYPSGLVGSFLLCQALGLVLLQLLRLVLLCALRAPSFRLAGLTIQAKSRVRFRPWFFLSVLRKFLRRPKSRFSGAFSVT